MRDYSVLQPIDKKLVLILDEFGTGPVSNDELKDISIRSGHPWNAGMTLGHGRSGTPGHLLEWIGGPDGPRTHRRLTTCGLHYASQARFAVELGVSVEDFVVAAARRILNRRAAAKRPAG